MKLTGKQKIFCYSIGIILGLSVKLFIMDIVRIEGTSMEPTLKNGSSVIINKLAYGIVKPFADSRLFSWANPKCNDIVIYLHNNNIVIKRIVATGGTPLDYSTNKEYTLFVNNTSYPLSEEQYNAMHNTNIVPDRKSVV